jgi:ABC-2 type transport system ATP-binding protein
VNDPEIVFLDEPTTGLDPQARHALWDVIMDLQQRGKTIFMTTHSMEEAERLCDRVAIVDHGKIIALGSPPP